jgi:molecular chaperone DnaJ
MKNYYFILGVKSDATIKQIREAYRRLAKELHPDYYGQDSGPFIDLQEAYAVLSDPTRRRTYDDIKQASYEDQGRSGRVRTDQLISRKPTPEPLIPSQDQAGLGELSLTHSFRTFGPSFEDLFDLL